MAENNQLVTLVNTKQNELWKVKASYLTESQDVYFKRAILNIFDNAELVKLSKTESGARSLFMCINRALQMGLQIHLLDMRKDKSAM
jgi:hypothetical protein